MMTIIQAARATRPRRRTELLHVHPSPRLERSDVPNRGLRTSRRSIFPKDDIGSCSTKSILFGTLKLDSDRLQWAIKSASLTEKPGCLVTTATTISPHVGSGAPTTAAICTAGCL